MNESDHIRDRRALLDREIMGHNRPSEKRLQPAANYSSLLIEGICSAFSATNVDCVFPMPFLRITSLAPFRSSDSANRDVTCFGACFPICENVLLEMLDFHSLFRSPRFRAVFWGLECSPDQEVNFGRGSENSYAKASSGISSAIAPGLCCAKTSLEGDGCMKDTHHPIRHPSVHPLIFGRVLSRGSCASSDHQFGRRQNTGLGWSDPTFVHVSVPNVIRGVAPAQLRGNRAGYFVRVQMGRRTTPKTV